MKMPDLSQYKNRKIAIALSGGVDSSLSLYLLKKAGAEICGFTMRLWKKGIVPVDAKISRYSCFTPHEDENVETCKRLCKQYAIPYYDVDLSDEFEATVLGYVKAEYLGGRTPNPCVACNSEIKFGLFLKKAEELFGSFDYFATGHYVRMEERDGFLHLRQAVDRLKDQSYFLNRIPALLYPRLLFPLGSILKSDVKALALEAGIHKEERKESQDFFGGNYNLLFDTDSPGDIIGPDGSIIGKHKGLAHYTIGQRRGIGVSAGSAPAYVSRLDPVGNRVILASDSSLFYSELSGKEAFTIDPALSRSPFRALVKIRQSHRPEMALVSIEGRDAQIRFDRPQRAIAPGQSAVFYDEDGFLLGASIIDAAGG